MGSNIKLAIKIDIDTLRGYLEGLPKLLDILSEHKVKASIFFSLGPDNSGKALRRIFRKGFISKMLRTKAPTAYGIKTLFYGTLLPAPMIANSNPDLIRRAIYEGHDCGIHSWDHVYWQDNLPKLTREIIRNEFHKSMELYEKIAGERAKSCAAPGWQVTCDSLRVQDELDFDYCSDVRGYAPFMPELDGVTFRTPQVPSTLPTMDEVLGLVPQEKLNDYYMKLLHEGLNVHTIHTEMEGGMMSEVFREFLSRCSDNNTEFMTLREALKNSQLIHSRIEMGELKGRAGKLAVQL
ncbi:MAG: 4-deoxy-4-formamido-L-arabinose-phosphoundecaprenol deformylase [Synergistaceae bacterium]|nr:4-deoxy-4-formamido-L-arabinose-phosphoundecaprenol deformylase [Synergistaceae bacterium]MBQ3449407.1 4-deoxy-4-formamido-L-arabinose-phosphoundecaprenol deformylase [Synergistaceae bacterium]